MTIQLKKRREQNTNICDQINGFIFQLGDSNKTNNANKHCTPPLSTDNNDSASEKNRHFIDSDPKSNRLRIEF